VILLNHLTPTQRRALVVADNRLALSAGWDEELLHIELAALREEDFNLESARFRTTTNLPPWLVDEDETKGLTDGRRGYRFGSETPVSISGKFCGSSVTIDCFAAMPPSLLM